jgi:hypothetical protein
MISSEVQRTLVKSPPELWAELSDPALLARHLGELGDIRITRVEPEQIVEWEAENTNGTVQIKPSGWGTRVTLTVIRELPEDAAKEAARPGAPPASDPTPQSDAEPMPQSDDGPMPQSDDGPGPEAGAGSAWHTEPEPAGEADGGPAWLSEGVASFTPEPLPAAEVEHEAAAEVHAEGGDAKPLGAETLPVRPFVWLVDDERERRRGFFGRLFGRRRRPRGTELEAIESLGEMDPLNELAEETAPGEADLQALAASEDSEAPAPSAADASLAPASQPWQPDASCKPLIDPAPVDDGRASAQMAPADQPEDARPGLVPAADMSSELKAAEEAATAEVTAMLTSVLDRLGAAHHRPFSRS